MAYSNLMFAAGSSSSSHQGRYFTGSSISSAFALPSGSDYAGLVHAQCSSGGTLGNFGGYANYTSTSELGPVRWTDTSTPTRLGPSSSRGLALWANPSGIIAGYYVNGGSERPFAQVGSNFRQLSTDPSNGPEYARGQAQVVNEYGDVAGWIGDGSGTGHICYWEYNPLTENYAFPVMLEDENPRTGYVVGMSGSTFDENLRIVGYLNEDEKVFRWDWNEEIVTMGEEGEAPVPQQAVELVEEVASGVRGAIVGNSSAMPYLFLFNERDGSGIANDLKSVLAPDTYAKGSSATVTGISRQQESALQFFMGGKDWDGSGKVWTCELDTAWARFDFEDVEIEVGDEISGSELYSAFPDGDGYLVQKPSSISDVDRIRMVFKQSYPAEPDNVTFRFTARANTPGFAAIVQFWDGSGWDTVGDPIPLQTYMQTHDVADPDPGQHAFHSGDWHEWVRIRVVPSGIYTTPVVNVLFEQANCLVQNAE